VDKRDRFAEVYLKSQLALRSYLYTLTRDQQGLEDLLQEVSLVIWRKFDQYDFERPFLPWAMGIARLEAAHWRRVKSTEKVQFTPEVEESLAKAYADVEDELSIRRRALAKCIEKLGENGRELLHLRYQRNLSLNEISKLQGSTLNAINKALGKIRRLLQECTRRSSTYLKGSS